MLFRSVQHDTVQRARVECLVFIVGRDRDEEFCLPLVHLGTQGPAIGLCELVRIARCSAVPHVPAACRNQMCQARYEEKFTYENSVVLVCEYLDSMALCTGVGTGYSVMKFPFVSLTFLVTPRLMVWRRRHAVSTPLVDDAAESGRAYGSP